MVVVMVVVSHAPDLALPSLAVSFLGQKVPQAPVDLVRVVRTRYLYYYIPYFLLHLHYACFEKIYPI